MIKEWIRRLLKIPNPHVHTWKIISTQNTILQTTDYLGRVTDKSYFTDIILHCSECGEISERRVRGYHAEQISKDLEQNDK